MSDIAIRVEDVSKCYQVYEKPHDRVKQALLPPYPASRRVGRKALLPRILGRAQPVV